LARNRVRSEMAFALASSTRLVEARLPFQRLGKEPLRVLASGRISRSRCCGYCVACVDVDVLVMPDNVWGSDFLRAGLVPPDRLGVERVGKCSDIVPREIIFRPDEQFSLVVAVVDDSENVPRCSAERQAVGDAQQRIGDVLKWSIPMIATLRLAANSTTGPSTARTSVVRKLSTFPCPM
jgi:hypothetical protein